MFMYLFLESIQYAINKLFFKTWINVSGSKASHDFLNRLHDHFAILFIFVLEIIHKTINNFWKKMDKHCRVKRNILWEILQAKISKVPEKPKWNVWVLLTVEQSCLTCYHFKWGKPKTQICTFKNMSKDWIWKNIPSY